MRARFRRPAAAAIGAALLIPSLVACGDSSDGDETSSQASESSSASESASDSASGSASGDAAPEGELDQVSFSGDVGDSLEATWNAEVPAPDSTSVTTLVKGDGDAVAEGDTVSVYLWLGNGTKQSEAFSDYTNGAPESLPNDGSLGDVFTQLFQGQTYGSRVAAVTTPAELFGPNADSNQLGVDSTDSLVVVADLVSKVEEAPTPTSDTAEDAPADSQPTVVEVGGKPTGLDFSGIDEPALDTPVQRVVLKEGDGAAVKASDTVTVNYLGATYDADQPFDESYSGQPLTSPLSGLIQGWSIGLEGVKVGSRVLLQIPPAFGYGSQGSGDSIPGNSTLWFVIDVVSVG